MSVILNGSTILSYGPLLPTGQIPDGALFYKTTSAVDGPSGLYLYGFIQDINPNAFGSQVSKAWSQVSSPDLFVSKTGDTMLGALTVPGMIKITQNNTSAQNLLIGNSAGSGVNKPGVIQGLNGAVLIGSGTNWSTGGTISGLQINSSAGSAGLTYLGNQVFHTGNDGVGSTLDSDLLDGQHGAFYQNASNVNAGVLGSAFGGTGRNNSAAPNNSVAINVGGVLNYTSAPTGASQVLMGSTSSGGSVVWQNTSALSVASAVTANTATTATTATTANFATTAGTVNWGNINFSPSVIFSAWASNTTAAVPPFHWEFAYNTVSPNPTAFTPGLHSFNAYSSTDFPGSYFQGIVSKSGGTAAIQIAGCWDAEENAPNRLYYRTNDDSSNISAWGLWARIWDNQSLVNVSQLANDSQYLRCTPGGTYTLKTDVGNTDSAYTTYIVTTNGADNTLRLTASANVPVGTASTASTVTTTASSSNLNYAIIGTYSAGALAYASGSTMYFNPGTGTIAAPHFSTTSADLGEKYTTDKEYEIGTIIVMNESDDSDGTISTKENSRVLGVVSGTAGLIMNEASNGQILGLRGRLPIYVVGKIKKCDELITSNILGTATKAEDYHTRVFAQSLETDDRTERRLIECVVF